MGLGGGGHAPAAELRRAAGAPVAPGAATHGHLGAGGLAGVVLQQLLDLGVLHQPGVLLEQLGQPAWGGGRHSGGGGEGQSFDFKTSHKGE